MMLYSYVSLKKCSNLYLDNGKTGYVVTGAHYVGHSWYDFQWVEASNYFRKRQISMYKEVYTKREPSSKLSACQCKQ